MPAGLVNRRPVTCCCDFDGFHCFVSHDASHVFVKYVCMCIPVHLYVPVHFCVDVLACLLVEG